MLPTSRSTTAGFETTERAESLIANECPIRHKDASAEASRGEFALRAPPW